MCTMMAGVMLVIVGATGMVATVNCLPRPVAIGFTNGIAVSRWICPNIQVALKRAAEIDAGMT